MVGLLFYLPTVTGIPNPSIVDYTPGHNHPV